MEIKWFLVALYCIFFQNYTKFFLYILFLVNILHWYSPFTFPQSYGVKRTSCKAGPAVLRTISTPHSSGSILRKSLA